MAYNRFLYNSALYNAGREEVGAVARSIIQAHTGPHIQAVVGHDPGAPSGVSFISDFNIIEGTITSPPSRFYFPDLKAAISAVRTGQDDLAAFMRGLAFLDLPASVFPVAYLPDLKAVVFGLFQSDLPASILGKLAELDLGARLQIVQEDLIGIILGIEAPNLPGCILGIPAPTLGAIIWSPTDLPAALQTVQKGDLPGDIFAFQFSDLPGNMLGIPAPRLLALIRGFESAQKDLPGSLSARLEDDLLAEIVASIPGPNDVTASIDPVGGAGDLLGLIRQADPGLEDLLATIGISIDNEFDLPASIDFLSALGLGASIGTYPLGRNDRFLPAALQPVHRANLKGLIESNSNLKNLSAIVQSLFGFADLGAFLRASETFVTALLTVSTYAAANLRATIGNPSCAGGSANANLSALAVAQRAFDLRAVLQSFLEQNLGASINQSALFYAIDQIDITFSPYRDRPKTFLTTDTINVVFSPFRGLNLSAAIQAVLPNVDLPATITAALPLPRVESAVNRITAAELRLDRVFSTEEIRLQLEGQLLDYFYVNGTDDAFIKDADENWKLNIRSFQPIAAGLFGDFAAGRVCRLVRIASFSTLDEAVRSCIAAVIGLEGEANLSASLVGSGGTDSLLADISVSDVFFDLDALVNRVFPADIEASITAVP